MIWYVFILRCLWLFAPAGFANMAPSVAAKIFPKFNFPLDFNLSVGGTRVFGSHKTIRGLLFGVLTSIAVFSLQKYLYTVSSQFFDLSMINYSEFSYLFGMYFGIGAIFGDALKSFFKRRLGIQPGKSWFPFDQLDWLLGTLLVVSPVLNLSFIEILYCLIIGLVLHLVVKCISFVLKIDDTYL